jgi:hypothetical protein
MNGNPISVLAAVLLLGSGAALGQTPQAHDEEDLLERAVVRNRLFSVANRLEVTPSVGLTVVN